MTNKQKRRHGGKLGRPVVVPNPVALNLLLPKALARWIDRYARAHNLLVGQDRKRPNRSAAVRAILEAERQREPTP